jgi:hypothetical protein
VNEEGLTVHEREEINDEDGDQNQTAEEDMRVESEDCPVAGQVGSRDVAGLMISFVHA